VGEKQQNHWMPPVPTSEPNADGNSKMENKLIDLNMKPNNRIHEHASNNQVRVHWK